MATTTTTPPRDFLDALPDLALRRVATLLDGRALARLGCCSRALCALASDDDALWRALVRRRFGRRHCIFLPPPAQEQQQHDQNQHAHLLASVLREAREGPGGGWAFFPGLEPCYNDEDEDEGEEGDQGGAGNSSSNSSKPVPLLPLLNQRKASAALNPALVRKALEEAEARGFPAVCLDARDDGVGGDRDGDEDDSSDEEEEAACEGGGGGAVFDTAAAEREGTAAPAVVLTAAALVPAAAFPPPRRPPILRRLGYHPLAGTFVRLDACESLGLEPPSSQDEQQQESAAWPPPPVPGWTFFGGWRVPPVASVWPRELLASAYFAPSPAALLARLSAQHRRALASGGPRELAQVPQAVEARTGRYHGFSSLGGGGAAALPPGTTAEAAALRRGTPLPPQASWRPVRSWSEGVYVRADVAAERGFLQRREWERRMAEVAGRCRRRRSGQEPPPATAVLPSSSQSPHRDVYSRLSRLSQPAARAERCSWLDGDHATVVSRHDACEHGVPPPAAGGGGPTGPAALARLAERPMSGLFGTAEASGDDETYGPVLRIRSLCWLDVLVKVPGVPCGRRRAHEGQPPPAPPPVDAHAPSMSGSDLRQQSEGKKAYAVVWRLDLSAARVGSPLTFHTWQASGSRATREATRALRMAEPPFAFPPAAASSGNGGGSGRWVEHVLGPVLLEPTSSGYATVVAHMYAHDGAWKQGIDVDSVHVRPWDWVRDELANARASSSGGAAGAAASGRMAGVVGTSATVECSVM